MLRLKVRDSEFGRTMMEILTVLVIIGLLTAIMVPVIYRAMAKSKANEIVHDGRIIQMESSARMGDIAPGWQTPRYQSKTGKDFQMMRDIKGQNYVKISGVEKAVCKHMLNLQVSRELVFLTEPDYTAFTECGEENTMVMGFEGAVIPAECESEKNCQDKYGAESERYCDGSGQCIACDPEISEVTWEGDGCQCKEGVDGQSCQDDRGHTWCCANGMICGDKMGTCAENPIECQDVEDCVNLGKTNHYCDEQGQCTECGTLSVVNQEGTGCICDATQAVSCDDGNGNTWCCGPDANNNGQICGDEADTCVPSDGKCQYTINVPTASNMVKSTNCSYSVSISGNIGTMTPQKECTLPDEYCYLAYADSDCDPQLTGSINSGIIYGNCIKRNQGKDNGLACQISAPSAAAIATEVKGCSANKYCYLKWKAQGCASSDEATSATTGTFYGVCLPHRLNSVSCPYNN